MAACTKHVSVARQWLSMRTSALVATLRGIASETAGKKDYVSYGSRTHTCNELRGRDSGQNVSLCGWAEFQRMDRFLTLRDAHGCVQLVFPPTEFGSTLKNLRPESVIQVEGKVSRRPPGQENQKMTTGDIEVVVSKCTVLNECKQLPFEVKDHAKVKESLRLKYRYLDLRSSRMQHNLRLRSDMVLSIREFLCNRHGFVDVETPTLFRNTPGGAQEFLVPTQKPGKFYALPQSPQQFKQLLMVGGVDRYLQIARCYRDEGSRPDRQPEFTQLDLEMSFVSREDVERVVEDLLAHSWPDKLGGSAGIGARPFNRITYAAALDTFGSDKPDVRYGMQLKDLTAAMKQHCSASANFAAELYKGGASVKAICVKNGSEFIKKADLEFLHTMAKAEFGVPGLGVAKVKADLSWHSPICKHLQPGADKEFSRQLDAVTGDTVIFVTAPYVTACKLMGKVRTLVARLVQERACTPLYSDRDFQFLWVEDFPLFLPAEDGSLESAHHPFTAPHVEDIALVYSDPLKARSLHYDLVLNGSEVGGGSIRIHDWRLQKHVLDAVLGSRHDGGDSQQPPSSQLNHLLEALQSGCPPHGGIALGLDRLFAIVCGVNSIRDVIAFPKTSEGADLMSGAPCEASARDLQLYHIDVKKSAQEQT